MKNLTIYISLFVFLFTFSPLQGQEEEDKSPINSSNFSGLKWRNIGPAFTSGRIADIAVHPENDNIWYVAVGSGGVWKTMNSGITWNPIFDKYSSYSTGCITLDPQNPDVVWLGSGENVGGRHVAYGDGIYVSKNAGKSWKNMGLKESQHISKIIVHPNNSNIIWVASQGPLWSKGGERGIYKSEDGGTTWTRTLGDEEWVGATDLLIDPRNPDVLYAATWQRHRNIASYMGGGPGSGIHKSTDGGQTWTQLKSGLPSSNLGKIGLAISPQNPDVLYAAVETDRTTGSVYKSTNKGLSWEKRSNTVSGGTGPHYYQELYASPHQFDKIYLMDVRIQVSSDGGTTFSRLPERSKHSDNHAMAFRADDPDYLLIGSDGGLYESYDNAAHWRFINNMPITQYYKVAVDDALPYYNIYGGTQDNGSHGGPVQTDNSSGIRNSDWFKTLGADGHQSAVEPGNPNIIYAETQIGGLHRVDRITGEQVYIKPQPGENDGHERFNWDAPIIVSSHDPARIYFASYRIWRSENRGDSWTAISGDLTRNQERFALPIMGKVQSIDNPWDLNAMSTFNTITSLGESPLNENIIYAGTDDGIIQVTDDGGANWRKIDAEDLPGVPPTAFTNDIRADLHDENTVYLAMDNHKYGDFTPYLLKSTNKGKSWKLITDGIKDRTLIWRVVQDHEDPNLLFAATEFGVYFTHNGGEKWTKLSSGMPTISIRDITIQRRENDLIAASFGRSFFVMDDYSVLRNLDEETLEQEVSLFSASDADRYVQKSIAGSQGDANYIAKNPEYGSVITYFVNEEYPTLKSQRKKAEKELAKEEKDIEFPGWEKLAEETEEEKPKMVITIKNEDGMIVRKLDGPISKGLNRVAWDLRESSKRPISLSSSSPQSRFTSRGYMVPEGNYSASLAKMINGEVTDLAGPVQIEVEDLREGALKGASKEEIAEFKERYLKLQTKSTVFGNSLRSFNRKYDAFKKAMASANAEPGTLDTKMHELKSSMNNLQTKLRGNPVKREIGENNDPSYTSWMFTASRGLSGTYGPTKMYRESLAIAEKKLGELWGDLENIESQVLSIEKDLRAAGAPLIEGQVIPDP